MKLQFSRRWMAGIVAMLQISVLGALSAPAAGAVKPSVALLTSAEEVTLYRQGDNVSLDLGVYALAVGGTFRIDAKRADWDQPIKAAQVDEQGNTLRRIPDRLLNGFSGLKDFFTITFTAPDGTRVLRVLKDFCPTGYERQRMDDTGPVRPAFADIECGFAFTRGIAWGIDRGWALNATPPVWREGEMAVDVPPGEYDVTVQISRLHAQLFDVPAEDRAVTVRAHVQDMPAEEPPHHPGEAGFQSADGGEPLPADTGEPIPAHVIPDLEALPAWNLFTSHEEGRDMLSFASTPWNSGPGMFVVEGFRRRGAKIMDAYQYFVDDAGRSYGRVPIGDMVFHEGGGHDHWHFLQFARFDLLGKNGKEVVRSQKQGFCMAATHPIDLTIPGATMRPWDSGLSSSCGGPTALWVREVLASGWGDTYQNVSGQAFDITDVPNGTYQVRVMVDPEDRLRQVRTDNDEALRQVTLGGLPGERTVKVAPWFGIDG